MGRGVVLPLSYIIIIIIVIKSGRRASLPGTVQL